MAPSCEYPVASLGTPPEVPIDNIKGKLSQKFIDRETIHRGVYCLKVTKCRDHNCSPFVIKQYSIPTLEKVRIPVYDETGSLEKMESGLSMLASEIKILGLLAARTPSDKTHELPSASMVTLLERLILNESRIGLVFAYHGDTLMSWNTRENEYKHVFTPCSEVFFSIALGLIKSISYIHGCGIVHKDIKPENVLIRYEPGDENLICSHSCPCSDIESQNIRYKNKISVKICDFNTSQIADMVYNCFGTVEFAPPELMGLTSERKGTTREARDMWSFGVTLYCMMNGYLPWYKEQQLGTQLGILYEPPREMKRLHCHIETSVSDHFNTEQSIYRGRTATIVNLLEELLHKEPQKRPPLEDVYKILSSV